jgi:hypothetical protein
MWPAKIVSADALLSKLKKEHNILTNIGFFIVFDKNCCPQSRFVLNLRPAEQFFPEMWPSSAFEFDTPGLNQDRL